MLSILFVIPITLIQLMTGLLYLITVPLAYLTGYLNFLGCEITREYIAYQKNLSDKMKEL